MKIRSTALACCVAFTTLAAGANEPRATGYASWYGEDHRGRLMANGKKFNPDKLTAASWFYPLGTRVRVTALDDSSSNKQIKLQPRSVLVTITDRGPAKALVRDGRIIDLGRAAFTHLAHPDLGLVQVTVQPLK
jgi:rare lipoprotein A